MFLRTSTNWCCVACSPHTLVSREGGPTPRFKFAAPAVDPVDYSQLSFLPRGAAVTRIPLDFGGVTAGSYIGFGDSTLSLKFMCTSSYFGASLTPSR
jgi:hypothetical protein